MQLTSLWKWINKIRLINRLNNASLFYKEFFVQEEYYAFAAIVERTKCEAHQSFFFLQEPKQNYQINVTGEVRKCYCLSSTLRLDISCRF